MKTLLALLALALTACSSPPRRITDDLGRTWEQRGPAVWECIALPPALNAEPVSLPGKLDA